MSDFQARANEEAEVGVIGMALVFDVAIPRLVAELDPADFYVPLHGAIFAAIRELYESGHKVDAVSVWDILARDGREQHVDFADFNVQAATPSYLSTYCGIIRREAAARSLQTALGEARHQIDDAGDPVEVADNLSVRIKGIDRAGKLPERYWADAGEYMQVDHTETLTPLAVGVCYPLSRIMVIASEKLGKSTLVRQIAFCLAAGIHPFDSTIQIDPVRTLIFDAENDDDELVPSMEKVRQRVEYIAGADAPRPGVYSVPYGCDFETRRDRSDFQAVLEDFRPQIIVGGPVYKLTDQTKDMSEDRRAAIVQSVFNDVRKRFGSAVILEHHAPTGNQNKARNIKAKGGQVWEAWVNMTIALHSFKEGESAEVKYPHPPRGHFRWPKRFDRGRTSVDWPWMPVNRRPLNATPELALVPTSDGAPPPDEPPDDWKEEPF